MTDEDIEPISYKIWLTWETRVEKAWRDVIGKHTHIPIILRAFYKEPESIVISAAHGYDVYITTSDIEIPLQDFKTLEGFENHLKKCMRIIRNTLLEVCRLRVEGENPERVIQIQDSCEIDAMDLKDAD